jgi:DNA-binding beta-propeller fold protein YncE
MRFPQLVMAVLALLSPGIGAADDHRPTQLWQTNSRGDDIHIVDIATHSLLERLIVGPEPHGIATDRAQKTVYVTIERNGERTGELLWIDPISYAIKHRLPVGPEPHQLAVTPDGRFAYVPCRDEHYWVIDTESRTVVTKIHTGGRPHNTSASPDGRFMYLSPMGSPHAVTIVDVEAGHRVIGTIPFDDSVRPPALSSDGQHLFQQIDGLNGFQAANVEDRKVVSTVEHSTRLGLIPLGFAGWLGLSGLQRCHGLGIRPDQTEIWSVCGGGVTVHDLTRPSYPEVFRIALKNKGYWLTFSPDSRWAFVALAGVGEVAVIDARKLEVVAHFPAGKGPKRNLVIDPNRKSLAHAPSLVRNDDDN